MKFTIKYKFPNLEFALFLFLLIFLPDIVHTESLQTIISEKRAINLSNKFLEKENWNHKDKTIKTQIASDPWCDCLPSKQEINLLNNEKTTENEKKALSEFFDFLNHLSNRTYWVISYSPKNRLVLDGGVCIIIDAYTGEYLGRFGMGLPGYY